MTTHDEDEPQGMQNIATERGVLEFDTPQGRRRAMYNGCGTWDVYKHNGKCWYWHVGVSGPENIGVAALYENYKARLERGK